MNTLVLGLLCGGVIGLALGMLGAGGGVLTVPALVFVLGFSPSDAVVGGLLIVVVTSAVALARHARSGPVAWMTGSVFAAVGVPTAVGASLVAHRVPQGVLTMGFAVVAALAAAVLLWGPRPSSRLGGVPRQNEEAALWKADVSTAVRPGDGPAGSDRHGQRTDGSPALTADDLDGPATCCVRKGRPGAKSRGRVAATELRLRLVLTGAGTGVVTGMLGVGGGFLVVPALVTFLRLPMRTAVGTGLVIVFVNSTTALAAHAAVEGTHVDWPALGPLAAASVLGAWEGRRLGTRLPAVALRRAFAALLLTLSLFLLGGVLL